MLRTAEHGGLRGRRTPRAALRSLDPGITLADQLVEAMRASGLAFAPPDNWRDVGWSSSPAAIRPRIVKRETVARCRRLSFQAATALQPLLAATFESVRWALDADPSQGATSPHPTPTPLADEYQVSALVHGVRRYPWLAALLPVRPTGAAGCSECDARGWISYAQATDGEIQCPQCHGMGWLRRVPEG